jgi:hypothetical protein
MNNNENVTINMPSFSDDMRIDRRRLEEWCQTGGSISPLAQGLIAQALFALDEAERCKQLLAVQRTEKARTALLRYREACEDEVTYYVSMFNKDPNAAVAGLKRSAAGVRHLISRWEELYMCLCDEGTWYGTHRYEAIQMQGQYAGIDQLFLSEEAWKTWIDCLAAQPVIKQFDIDTLCAPDIVPKSIQDRDQPLWQPDPAASRARLRALVERELPALRIHEAELRTVYEEPALAAAEDLALARLTRDETVLLRALRSHEAAFRQAATALEKFRRPTAGAPPVRDAALATPPACADPRDPAARPRHRRVPITPPFARPGGGGSPAAGSKGAVYGNKAGAAQVHGAQVCRDWHRVAGAESAKPRNLGRPKHRGVESAFGGRPSHPIHPADGGPAARFTGTKLTRRKPLRSFRLRREICAPGPQDLDASCRMYTTG